MFKILILIFSASSVWGSEIPSQNLDSLIHLALKNNPAILEAKEHWKSLMAQVPAAATWEDPQIGFQRMNYQGGAGGNYWSVAQNVPFPGKLSQAAKMKRHEAMIAYQKYRAAELDIAAQVAVEYYRIFWLRETSSILKKDSDILRGIAQVAQASVASGRANSDEALSARAAFLKVKDAAMERENESLVEEEALNALLSRPAGTRWILSRPEDPRPVQATPQELDQLAKEMSPDYALALHEIMHAKAMVALSRLGFLPDFQFSMTQEARPYVATMEDSAYGINLSIPLWFWKQNSLLKAAKAHKKEAEASSQEAVNEALRQVHSELIEVNLRSALALSYKEEIIPLARSAFKITEKNYETGRANFSKLSDSVRALLDAQLKYPEEVRLYGEHLAKLERAVGGSVPFSTKKGESKP